MYFWRRAVLGVAALALAACVSGGDWRTASRESAGLAPDPKASGEAVLMVFGARAWGWRGWFAIHTWISAKRTGEDQYTVYEVVGWREHQGLPALRIEKDLPDRFWYGAKPEILQDIRGTEADALIAEVDRAAKSYPWPNTYSAWPGPNSNTFTAWIAKQVPGLRLGLPDTSIGKNWLE